MHVVVILPTFNERENIDLMLRTLMNVTGAITGHTFSVLVVDDNSPDGTQEVVRAFQKTHKSVHLLSGEKEGLGRALLRGMSYAVSTMKADIILQLDADLSHNPEDIKKFMAAIDAGADFVVGSRYIKGGSIPENWGINRKIYSVIGNSIVRFGLGYPEVHDWTGGFRAFNVRYFTAVKDKMHAYSGYVYQIAFLHKAILAGAQVKEVPIHFTDRRYGHSKIAPSEYIRKVIEYVGRQRIKRTIRGSFGKFLVVGSIGFVINTIVLELLVRYGYHPALGSALGAELAIMSNFMLNNAWTFGHRKIKGKRHNLRKFLQFNTTSLGAILLQAVTVYVGTHLFGVELYRLYYMIGIGFGLVWNYWMYSHVIWKPAVTA